MAIKNRYELDPERLATTDELGARVYLYPEDIEGKWKSRRIVLYWFLIILYLSLPWINVKGRPALMLNIFTREFAFMGMTLHGVEPILIFLIVISGLFFMAFLTSIFGRVWCGWTCPQTVFIQTIFSKIETLIEGGARARRALDESSWTPNKIMRRTLKWICFTIVSFHIAHTFIGYFIGPRALLAITLHSPLENLGTFTAAMIMTSIFLLDFGWFREQFCIIACPYGRMQSVMMDENSLVVAYDKKRGEPRRGLVPRELEGDCINDYACVRVCPTGIDIRRGTQMECIACTACIDACDDIMDKVKKPHGLIRYSTETELIGKKHNFITTRSVLYFCIFLFFISAFGHFIVSLSKPALVFYRGTDSPFQVTMSPSAKKIITNHFTLKITHQGSESFNLKLEVSEESLRKKIEIISPLNNMKIEEPEIKTLVLFKFDPDILINGSRAVKLNVIKNGITISTENLVLIGPGLNQ
ncbi:MAG: cytochrome c oxidase accessory protein CcoG [Bacteriovorax sp.]|nr:cytochrome c oxidase accessory protein CcoG [Bacteriovorax sp.]